MEVPPDEDELEKILSSNETEEIIEESVSETNEDDGAAEEISDVVDYTLMKVAELKELLKEKNLPVSGTKSELIERLQTWVKRIGSFYHSGSQRRREIKFGQSFF